MTGISPLFQWTSSHTLENGRPDNVAEPRELRAVGPNN